ncbi:MAG: ATP-dependent DNA helicase RecG [Clostridia bacterium]|nr:ATP-dependent DNA helicase RecG [Clostridia bacterium]
MIYNGINSIKSIGPAREKLFNKIGVFTVEDMLNYYPRDYEDRSKVKKICELSDGENALIKACAITVVKNSRIRRGLSLQKLKVSDGTGVLEITWFNQDWISRNFDISQDYFFYGKAVVKNHRIEMTNPVYESCNEAEYTNKIVPIYPLTAKLTQKTVQSTVLECLKYVPEIPESLPDFIREKYTLCGIDYAVKNIHFPEDFEKYGFARRRLAFEELFYLQIAMRYLKNRRIDENGIKIEDKNYSCQFVSDLPFNPTEDQIKVIGEIVNNMSDGRKMNRLVQGDVGCGKTIVAAAAAYVVIKNGYQAVMMAPTEILASQHFETISEMFNKYGINTVLLTGSMTTKQKREIYSKIKTGEADFVIGTHAVIQKETEFKKIALVITDEQHRFGVKQRSALADKGINPHVLVMTATPIPRTLALILYGDLDISAIKQMPPGRKPVLTYAVDEGMRKRINKFMLKQISEGRQIYIVCPAVENSEFSDELKTVTDYADELKKNVFKNQKIAIVHGKMPAKEKDEIMTEFYNGDIDVLVSTTVIEVGVNVPNANTMIIENAERFGLSQLHQLRGRVGRGKWQSYCIMFCQGGGDVSKQRMEIMTKTNDGFEISQKDLEIRGPGEFFGTRQHGLPELKTANIYSDTELVKISGEAADYVLFNKDKIADNDLKIISNQIKKIFSNVGEGDFS